MPHVSPAQSYEHRYHLPGTFYVITSPGTRLTDGRRIFKVGATTLHIYDRLRPLQGRYAGIWDWDVVGTWKHDRPFHLETWALRDLGAYKLTSLDGRNCGREMLAAKDERPILRAALEAMEYYNKILKLRQRRR
jgi:hypothetical protein